MPIGEYGTNKFEHFLEVYEELFLPAASAAGYQVDRADKEKACNIIQFDIIEKIISSDIVICDLSEKNPNVLYELGIRQAFDLPVVLVQEYGTERIFDIGNIRTINYDKNLNTRRIKTDIKNITEAIINTAKIDSGINSIMRFIHIQKNIRLEEEINSKDTDVLLNSLLNKVQDIEDTQLVIYESLNNEVGHDEHGGISEKWKDFTSDYIKYSMYLTSLVREIICYNIDKEKFEKIIGEIEYLKNNLPELPHRYRDDLLARIVSFRRFYDTYILKKFD